MSKKCITLCIDDNEVEQINKILLDEIKDLKNDSDMDNTLKTTMLSYYQGIYSGLNNHRFERLSSQELYTVRELVKEDISFSSALLKEKAVSPSLLEPALSLLKSVVKKIDAFFDESHTKIVRN